MIKITKKDLIRVQNEIDKDTYYANNSKAINGYIKKHPNHTNIEEVMIKVMLIDLENSTNLTKQKNKITFYDIVDVLINTKNIDSRISKGDVGLVKELVESIEKKAITLGNQPVTLLSFVSKYCQIHSSVVYNNDHFVKYDNVVKNHLYKYTNNKVVKTKFEKNYDLYLTTINDIIKEQGLEDINKIREKIDHYIWWENR